MTAEGDSCRAAQPPIPPPHSRAPSLGGLGRVCSAVVHPARPSFVWRTHMALSGGDPTDTPTWYPLLLSGASVGLGLLTLGLVYSWGEAVPRWFPVFDGRRVPDTRRGLSRHAGSDRPPCPYCTVQLPVDDRRVPRPGERHKWGPAATQRAPSSQRGALDLLPDGGMAPVAARRHVRLLPAPTTPGQRRPVPVGHTPGS